MEPAIIAKTVFLAVSILLAALFHRKVDRLLIAAFLSAFTTAVVFLLLSSPNPVMTFAFIPSFGIAFMIALLVGIPFAYLRRKGHD